MERAAGATLLPVNDREMLLQSGIIKAEERRFTGARTSAEEN